jgi:hypothetical protein
LQCSTLAGQHILTYRFLQQSTISFLNLIARPMGVAETQTLAIRVIHAADPHHLGTEQRRLG